jgi:hypothetical protein
MRDDIQEIVQQLSYNNYSVEEATNKLFDLQKENVEGFIKHYNKDMDLVDPYYRIDDEAINEYFKNIK